MAAVPAAAVVEEEEVVVVEEVEHTFRRNFLADLFPWQRVIQTFGNESN